MQRARVGIYHHRRRRRSTAAPQYAIECPVRERIRRAGVAIAATAAAQTNAAPSKRRHFRRRRRRAAHKAAGSRGQRESQYLFRRQLCRCTSNWLAAFATQPQWPPSKALAVASRPTNASTPATILIQWRRRRHRSPIRGARYELRTRWLRREKCNRIFARAEAPSASFPIPGPRRQVMITSGIGSN